jgi:integrase
VLKVLKQPVPVLNGRKRTEANGAFWDARTETATRVLSRIRAIMTAAKAIDLCAGDNPAEGLVEGRLITAKPKSRRVVHRPALPWEQIPELLELLRANTSISARALELAILCACRPGEVLRATLDEFHVEHKDGPVWIIPAERMKAGKEHRIPLALRAVEIVKEMQGIKMCGYAFPGLRSGKPLSDMAMTQLMRGMKLTKAYTAHGTARSGFRDWASNRTTFPDPIIEVALAHVNDDKTREAYARSDLFDLRRLVMHAWDAYCAGTEAWDRFRLKTKAGQRFCLDGAKEDWLAEIHDDVDDEAEPVAEAA